MTATSSQADLPTAARTGTRVQRSIKLLTTEQISDLKPELADVIEYRKSGLSLNHIVGCPLDCSYCVRHLFDNFDLKTPRAIMTDEDAVDALVSHEYFRPNKTPIQLFNRATDPMLPVVKEHTFRTLQLLDNKGLNNHVLVITRWRVDDEDCARLNSFRNIKLTILVTRSGIKHEGIEPVDTDIATRSLKTLYKNAVRYRTVLYWRPIVPGLNDTDEHIAEALNLSHYAHATVFTGLFFRKEIEQYYKTNDLPLPYDDTARRKIMSPDSERRILDAFRTSSVEQPYGSLFRKTSCGVSYAHRLPDYNGHYGIRELCEICPISQVDNCRTAWQAPTFIAANELAQSLGATSPIEIDERAILTEGLSEQPRYYMQHGFAYQVHDKQHPHKFARHGRADIGWVRTPTDRSEDGSELGG